MLCVFGGSASLSWHLDYRVGGKIGLANAIIFVLGATAGVRYGMICYRTTAVDVSAAVAPVGTR